VSLGLRIRTIRQSMNLTLEQAAEACDLDLRHFQKIEAGTLNIELVTLVRLSVGLRQPIAVFFGGMARRDRVPRRR